MINWTQKIVEDRIPISVLWEMTWRCNQKCAHCFQYEANPQEELSTAEGIDLLEQLARAGALFLVLTGGEPLVRSDFFELCKRARELNFAISLLTNGTLVTPEIARRLHALAFMDIQISILGARAETHDAITGAPGSFEQAVNAIKLLRSEGLRVTAGVTLLKQNFSERADFARLTQELDCNLFVSPFVSPKNDGDRTPIAMRMSEEQLETWLGESNESGTIDPDTPYSLLCSAGITGAAINSRGDVMACGSIPLSAGSIRREPFEKIWRESDLFRKLREARESELKECPFCDKQQYCLRCPGQALVEDGDLFGPSKDACRYSAILHKICGNRPMAPCDKKDNPSAGK
jgi:radical SAM protein with 4Fe4S-binding SPASM domain